MKIEEYYVDDGLLYTAEHEWVRIIDESRVIVGITDYAAKTLNDVVYVDLSAVGYEVKRMSVFGALESIKAVSDLFSPVTGKVIKINEELATRPELVNQSPYEEGWIIEVEPLNLNEDRKELLDAGKYVDHIKTIIEKIT